MADIFISYASEDRERVKPLVAALEEQGWKVWWDRELVAGPSFERKIEEALDAARSVVVVWSSHSIVSDWVRAEANEGRERQILVPLLIDDVKPPLAYRVAQTARMVGWPDQTGDLSALIQGVRDLLGDSTVTPYEAPKEANSIAVLPFINMSSDPEQEYFSDGISEEILNSLVRQTRMKVIARTSSFQFRDEKRDIRDIGETLGVNHVLEGSVRKAGNRVRVTAQLIRIADGSHIWSDRYDRVLDDIFEVQDEVTARIVEALSAQLGSQKKVPRKKVNLAAYNACMQGRFHQNRNNMVEALKHYEHAIEFDPDYVDALVGMSQTRRSMVGTVRSSMLVERPLLEALLNRIRKLDPDHPEIRLLARFLDRYRGNWQQYIDTLYSLVREYPTYVEGMTAYAIALSNIRHHDAALVVIDAALELDPLKVESYWYKGLILTMDGRLAEARELFETVDQMDANLAPAMISEVAMAQGDLETVKTQLARGLDSFYFTYHWYEHQAVVARSEGRADEVETYLEPLRAFAKDQPSYVRMRLALVEGDLDEALLQFKKGVEDQDTGVDWLMHGIPVPHWLDLYAHPEYQRILASIGMDDASLAKLVVPPLPF